MSFKVVKIWNFLKISMFFQLKLAFKKIFLTFFQDNLLLFKNIYFKIKSNTFSYLIDYLIF